MRAGKIVAARFYQAAGALQPWYGRIEPCDALLCQAQWGIGFAAIIRTAPQEQGDLLNVCAETK
jgi:hypothetical protein